MLAAMRRPFRHHSQKSWAMTLSSVWLAVKIGVFLLLSLSSVEIIVIAYQQF